MKIDLHSVKRSLDRLRCTVHQEKATISIVNSNLSFSCCCEAFKKKIEAKATEQLQIESKKMIEEQMRKLFKK